MDDVAASVGFAGWAFAAMCDHALCVLGMSSWLPACKYSAYAGRLYLGEGSFPHA
jgi:hypothetical protein